MDQTRLETKSAVSLLRFHPRKDELAAVSSGAVQVWDVAAGTKRDLEKPARGQISTIDLSRDGRFLAAGSEGRSPVWIYDLQSGKITTELDH